MARILITGAAGKLGAILRESLSGYVDHLRLSDIENIEVVDEGAEIVTCDLGNFDKVNELVKGSDFIIHLGGISVEDKFETILNANIRGTYHIYEAARQNGVKRIVFASSNHTIGFYERSERLDASVPFRPDSLYGVSKCFGENLAQYYYDKFGIETVAIRIGSCFPMPKDRRMMATWLSARDFTDLIKTVYEADHVGYAVVYGASDNKQQWWDNHMVGYLGWAPQDSSEEFAEESHILNEETDPNDPAIRYQGGGFAAVGHFEDNE